MSVWTRLFGRSEAPTSAVKPRLKLESLETRELPAAPVTPLRWFQVGPAPVAAAAGNRDDHTTRGLENSSTAAVRHRFFAIVDRTTLAATTDANLSDEMRRPDAPDRSTSIPPGPADPAETERAARPLPVLLVLADRNDY